MIREVKLTQEQRVEHFKRLGLQPVPYGVPSEVFIKDLNFDPTFLYFSGNDILVEIIFKDNFETPIHQPVLHTGYNKNESHTHLDMYTMPKRNITYVTDEVWKGLFPNVMEYLRLVYYMNNGRYSFPADQEDDVFFDKVGCILERLESKEVAFVTPEFYEKLRDKESLKEKLGLTAFYEIPFSVSHIYKTEKWVLAEINEHDILEYLEKRKRELIEYVVKKEWWEV